MDRRSLIKTCLVFTAGVVVMPSCLHEKSKSSLLLKNIQIDGEQEQLLAELTETIIPKTNTPGAKDVSAHLFTLMMVDDCYGPADQKKFVAGLNAFEDMAKKKFSKRFIECTPAQRNQLVAEINANKNANDDVSAFYNITKKLTIQGYTGSQYYLTKVHVFEMVPGRFHGCVPVSTKYKA